MAIQRMSYLEVAPKVREASGANALSELRRMLNVPGVSLEQRAEIQDRIQRVQSWIQGTLPIDEPSVTHHTVFISELVSVKERVG